jgi:hypothetical protein
MTQRSRQCEKLNWNCQIPFLSWMIRRAHNTRCLGGVLEFSEFNFVTLIGNTFFDPFQRLLLDGMAATRLKLAGSSPSVLRSLKVKDQLGSVHRYSI